MLMDEWPMTVWILDEFTTQRHGALRTINAPLPGRMRTSGARGSRFPAFDFGGSIWPQASARSRTLNHARLAKHKLRIKYEDIFIIALQFAAARDIKTAGAKRFLPDKLSLVFH